jgi:EAL and modified HD-GYP domain-containing signal transduction protein
MDHFFVARQAILDSNQDVFAYELLFREGPENYFPEICPNEATTKIIEGGFIGSTLANQLSKNKSFINFTFDNIIKKHAEFLDPERVVIEILESAMPGKKLLAACIELKEQGFTLALDDYIDHPGWEEFLPYIDIIKIDIQHMPEAKWREIKKKMDAFPHLIFLAEKVETKAEFEKCKSAGFTYFQGYFFSKPEVLKGNSIPPSTIVVLDLMQKIFKKDVPIPELAKVIEKDVPITVRLLQYANSAKFKRKCEIDSIKRAAIILGYDELYKFASLLFLTKVAAHKPAELLRISLIRARFCELLTEETHPELKDLSFLTGLLSMLDALLDMKMEDLTKELPLPALLREALNNGTGLLGLYLSAVKHYQNAEWALFENMISSLGGSCENAASYYVEATDWCSEQSSR